ncbi:MAG: sigma-70 family RNA polymerase sigma factor [Kofleriaceae bacterium]
MVREPVHVEQLLAHGDWLRALARRLVGAAAADDVVQETWIAAMRSPPDVDRPPRPWLARVLRNVARMRHRGDARRARREEVTAIAAVGPTRPDEIVQRLEGHRLVTEMVLALDEPYRTTLVLHYHDGLALAEIARREGIPEATARWRHRQALDRLRARLDERAGGRGAWVAALAPLATPPSHATALVAGGLLMKKLVIGAIALALAAAVWFAWPSSARPAAPAPSGPAAGAHLRFDRAASRDPADRRGAIHGRVRFATDARGSTSATDATGAPVRITLFELIDGRPVERGERTGAGAQFEFNALGAGSYCIVATSGLATGSACDIAVSAGERVERDIVLAPRTVRLFGMVRDADGGAIAQPQVVAQRYPQLDELTAVRGGDDGGYELGLAPGWYQISFRGDGYAARRYYLEVRGDQRLDAKLVAASAIAGRVVDEQHQPVAGAMVSVLGAQQDLSATQSGPDGEFMLEGLRPGTFDVLATAGTRVAAPRPVRVAFGSTERIDLVLVESRAALDGRVLDEQQQPIAGARVELRGPISRVAHTGADGRFSIGGLVADEYRIAASAEGRVRTTVRRIIDGQTSVELVVPRGAMIAGVVRTAAGEPVAGASVGSTAVTLEDPRLDVQTDEQGRFSLGPLPAGQVRLMAHHPSHGATEALRVEIAGRAQAPVELVFGAAASIEGVVRYDDGAPARGARLSIAPLDFPAQWTAIADDLGRFSVGALPSGQYSVSAEPPASVPFQVTADSRSYANVETRPGAPQRIELVVPGGREAIRGQVVDERGRPVSGAAVWAERESGFLSSGVVPDEVTSYSWSDGSFVLEELPRGTFAIYASHPDLATGSATAVAAGAQGVLVTLRARASVAGRVVAVDGQAIRSFRLAWRTLQRSLDGGRAWSSQWRMFDHPEGRFELAGLEPTEELSLSVETADGRTGSIEPFVLAQGQQQRGLVITTSANGTVRGRLVSRATGQPAVGASIYFSSARQTRAFPVDANGRFEGPVAAGTQVRYSIMVGHRGSASGELDVEIRPGVVTELGDLIVELP